MNAKQERSDCKLSLIIMGVVIIALVVSCSGCVSARNQVGALPPVDAQEAQVRVGLDLANLPAGPESEHPAVRLAKAPFRAAGNAATLYAESFEERPILTTFTTVLAALTVGEITDSYGFSDLIDDIEGRGANQDRAPAPNTAVARDGGQVIVRDAAQGNFTGHSFQASGKGSQVIFEFQRDAAPSTLFPAN